jgi:hypothetical protein
METPETFRKLALLYAEKWGWRVLPVRPGTKVPALADWPRLATKDPATVDDWWSNGYAGFGIGIATGHESDLMVIDVDNGPGKFGDDVLLALCELNGPLPDTPTVLTPGGGRHIYFRWPGFNPVHDALGEWIDVQGEGRFVVAPPSVHPNGGVYAWEHSLRPSQTPVVELNGFLLSPETPRGRAEVDPQFAVVLEAAGFTRTRIDSQGAEHWTRPGKNPRDGTSLTVYPFPDSHATCYSPNAGLEVGRPYLPNELAQALGEPVTGSTTQEVARLALVSAATISIRRQRWLWRRRIPLGGAVILAGQEGLGKSTVAIDVAARATRGELEGDLRHPVSVVYVSAEDPEETVLVPRLVAAGADIGRVHFPRIEGLIGGLALPRDLDELAAEMLRVGARLLVLDPFSVHLGGEAMDAHKERDVRRALAPLAATMQQLEAAAIGIMHWNKAPSMVALDRVLGSRAFTAAARSVLGVGPDPDDPDSRLLVVAKSNFGPAGTPALSFAIEERLVDDPEGGFPIETSAVRWTGEREGVLASDLLRSESEEERGALAEACRFLTVVLNDGRVDAKDVEAARTAAGISTRTLERARRKLGVVTEPVKDADGRIIGWTVRLP